MKWKIPAKTFLLGEYAALADKSALLVTTTPYFELSCKAFDSEEEGSVIHPESPAGVFLRDHPIDSFLSWSDPYQGKGGLGASSAQFLACYLAYHGTTNVETEAVLEAYYHAAWSGKGLRPSGYDVIAQLHYGCVFINKGKKIIQSWKWPFEDLSFFLIHTGNKLSTHEYLQETSLPLQTDLLSVIVDEALDAFIQKNSKVFINCINKYHQQLMDLKKVAPHSLKLINLLGLFKEIVAIKGCGAMGSDILLAVCQVEDKSKLYEQLREQSWNIVATETDIAWASVIKCT